MKFESNIGIEIHCELNTKSKLFSSAKNNINDDPNRNINEIDLGYPGILPQLNIEAVNKALKCCAAFNCTLANELLFDRKHYFYFDLPKGFQITQYFKPIAKNGFINIWDETNKQIKKINITHIQIEEDTAKQIKSDNNVKLDFNRAGVPLLEIVTDATSIKNGQEAAWYVLNLRETMKYFDISEAKMENGNLRCDVNISIKKAGSSKMGTKVEIKNVNSLSSIKKAVEFELERQEKILLSNENVVQETRRWDEKTKTTVSMRKKETTLDYKYFRDPNLLSYQLDQNEFINLKQKINDENKLAAVLSNILKAGLNPNEAYFIAEDHQFINFLFELNETDCFEMCKIYLSIIKPNLDANGKTFADIKISKNSFIDLLKFIKNKTIVFADIKEDLKNNLYNGKYQLDINKFKHEPINVEDVIKTIFKAHHDSIVASKDNFERISKFLNGMLMKELKGRGNMAEASSLLIKNLQEYLKTIK